jgi:hypothetical protein
MPILHRILPAGQAFGCRGTRPNDAENFLFVRGGPRNKEKIPLLCVLCDRAADVDFSVLCLVKLRIKNYESGIMGSEL